jgi:FkbM family methyltransferase
MSKKLKKLVKKGINLLGWELSDLKSFNESAKVRALYKSEITQLKVKVDRLTYLTSKSTFANKEQLGILGLPGDVAGNLSKSKAQLSQDLFTLEYLNKKRDGYFVEFGATDGVSFSNTFLLEKEYGWKGILAEPARCWMAALKENRNCIIENRCIWSKSGEILTFNETKQPTLSTIDFYTNIDYNSKKREDKITYKVETISLNDLLHVHNAPTDIDYLSVDTEGSEFEILNAFDFSKYRVKIITVEHNFTPLRDTILKLLISKGYKRVFETISLFDDWYINESITNPG